MPLEPDYEDTLTSNVADATNSPSGPGAITAALFLQHFAGDVPWAHLDIASTGDSPSDSYEWTKGPSGLRSPGPAHLADRAGSAGRDRLTRGLTVRWSLRRPTASTGARDYVADTSYDRFSALPDLRTSSLRRWLGALVRTAADGSGLTLRGEAPCEQARCGRSAARRRDRRRGPVADRLTDEALRASSLRLAAVTARTSSGRARPRSGLARPFLLGHQQAVTDGQQHRHQ